MIRASIYQFTDLEAQNITHFKSISGGVAKHSTEEIEKRVFKNESELLGYLKKNYGQPARFDNRLIIQESEFTNFDIYLDIIQSIDTPELIDSMFPELESL